MKSCATCDHARPLPDRVDAVICCALPPSPMLVPTMQQGLDDKGRFAQKQVLVMQAHWPTMGVAQVCGTWRQKEGGDETLIIAKDVAIQ
jgi:hypothetical protein